MESGLLPNSNTIALWMLIGITLVIAAKVVTGTLLGQKAKEIYKIREKLAGTKHELEHHAERSRMAKDMISFAERQKRDLQHQIEIVKEDLEALQAEEGQDESDDERADPSLPAHMRQRGEGLFE